ncbi:Transposase-like Mu [Desulfofarcimen acetoxidans DSM 771]|uniref:Transposase-like Mu n=1 Tax=Desulfofarcimen acetoxidans (strain ATCC 49208 / DSM 771 / KCTC 5769 / VKM B-1644 / 5575) TaxID=485916 RepID=C8VZD6_DESAS|nr:Mu transposase C-terminal domain-containing protein [Desulfofarcimen acetoxidans]ACV64881.1 Transposase-like Mu [Desulfofarcimen acetoxidans DSM 771]
MAELKTIDNEIYLPVEEVALLLSITERAVRKKITSGQIHGKEERCNRGGRGGVKYIVPLSSLDDRVQMKYWKKLEKEQEKEHPAAVPENVCQSKTFDEYSEDDRQIIQSWIQAVKDWQAFRSGRRGDLRSVDESFVEAARSQYTGIFLSVNSLYRKWKAVRAKNYDALVDKRGRHRLGQNSIPELAWELFKYYYLDESQYAIKQCVDYVTWWCEKEMPELLSEIPSYHSFVRAVKTIPFAVLKYFREGDKAFEDDAAPYITRLYDDLEINDVWVADNHTLDVLVIEDGTEKLHRMYVTGFQDVRSRKIVGWYLTDKPNSEAVLYALRKAILKHGIPRYIYTDNGREFLCFDIGGRGRRKTSKSKKDEHTPPPIFARLGIEFWNAKVRNGRAKIIERAFKEFKDKFSRLMVGFTGGNPLEKPERLKHQVKSRKGILLDSKLRENLDTYIEGMYNETEQNGIGMYGRAPNKVYAEEMVTVRKATSEDLNLMLMRSTRMQTVKEKGVHLELYGEKLFYWDIDFLLKYQGHRVYLRYDPEDLRQVRIYNEKDEFLCAVPVDNETILKYGASKEDIRKASAKIKQFKKTVKAYDENSGLEAYPKIEAIDLMLWKAKQNMEAGGQKPNAKVVEAVKANEPVVTVQEAPADQTDSVVDLQNMTKNARKNMAM